MEYDIKADLRALEAMASNLIPYLYEEPLYGVISSNLPSLTVGGFLLRLYRLQNLEDLLTDNQQKHLSDAHLNFEHARSEWMVHYEGKVKHELRARINDLRNFVDEHSDDPVRSRNAYPVEATRRTIVANLQIEAEVFNMWEDEFEDELGSVDKRLRSILDLDEPNFIWPSALEPIYPKQDFWWLYGYPHES